MPRRQVADAALEIRQHSRYPSGSLWKENQAVALPKHGIEQNDGIDLIALLRPPGNQHRVDEVLHGPTPET